MAIRELPVTVSEYHKHFISVNSEKLKTIKENKGKVYNTVIELKKYIEDNLTEYELHSIDATKFKEFNNLEYNNGEIERKAKEQYINASNLGLKQALVPMFKLYEFGKCLKQINKLEKQIVLLEKLVKIKYSEYFKYIVAFYGKVHEKLILEGAGYAFGGNIGWICYNRVLFHETNRRKRHIDYKATRLAKQELLRKGLTPYSKEAADWCKERNIPYNGVEYVVYQTNEAFYELAYIPGTLPNAALHYHFTPTNYRDRSIKGKSCEELYEMCNGDVNKVFEFKCDIRTKLLLALMIKPNLYLNYIRNENQESVTLAASSR